MKLRNKLSITFALVVLLTVALVSLLSNIFINSEFKKYIRKQQEQKTQEIVSSISAQYDGNEMEWDLDSLHIIIMNAMHDGYIVKVTDADNHVLCDAEECDMESCMQIMNDISHRMQTKCPRINGIFSSKDFTLSQNGTAIGTASIRYFGPYFLSDNDFNFLNALNMVLICIGTSCLLLSVAAGLYMSKRISDPISKAAEAARKMSNGDYTAMSGGGNDTVELNELIDSVNLLAKSLRYQESLRKQLTADVSHELRTPVTSIQTHLEAMLEGMWEPTPERLASCYDEATRIGSLVKDLENLSRLDNDNVALNKKTVSLSQLWNRVVDSFEMDIENKGLTVTLDGNAPDVAADEDRMRQVAVNLLSNAIKYTPQKGHIGVMFSQTEKYSVFAVSDNGTGIPENELPFIFERFYRADKSRNRKTGGAGIGLAVIKSIVAAHGGTVKVESSLGQGSRFTVMLPI